MGGVAVVVLAILSLVDVVPRVLLPVSGIVFGVAFMVEGAAIAARQSAATPITSEEGNLLTSGAVTVELFAGLATLVLGVLALIGIAMPVLMAALVITGGGALIMSAGAVTPMTAEAGTRGVVLTTAVSSATASHLLAGIAGVVLGILALTNPGISLILSSVALIVLGAALTFSGTAVSTAMLRLFQHRA